MREIRQSGSEGGGTEVNRFSLPLLGLAPDNHADSVLGVQSRRSHLPILDTFGL